MAEKENIDRIDIMLDEQIAKFPTGVEVAKAKKQVPIKMVTSDLEFVTGPSGENTGVIICGICEVDGIKYAALYDPRVVPPKQYVEEIYLSVGGGSVKGFRVIQDPLEWNVIVDFFNRNHVWEHRRVLNWIMRIRGDQMTEGRASEVQKWVNKINRTNPNRNAKQLTVQDFLRGSLDAIRNLGKKK